MSTTWLLPLTIGVILTYPILNAIYNIYFHPLAHIPGPRNWAASRLPFIWALIRGTIVHDFEKLHRKYGPILRIAPDEVTFAKGEAWVDIFQGRPGHQQFLKDPIWWAAQPGQPDSIINAISPETHARIRKTLTPAFTIRALRSQERIIQQYTSLLVERLHERVEETKGNGVELDIVPWLHYTTFDIFGDLGFGESFKCLEHSKYHPWIALVFNSVKAASFIVAARFNPLVEFLLMKSIPRSLEKMQMDHYQHIVDKEMNGEKGMGEINSTFMILTNAGSETTATVLAGTLNYLINTDADKLFRLTDEIRKRFASPEEMTLEALQDLLYLNAVIKEGLRLCPPIPWVLPRKVPVGGDSVCGVWLPGGTPVSIQAYSINRDPTYFYSADEFLPERWLPEATDNPESPFYSDQRDAIQPFSVGPRSCMGQPLAWAEMRLVLAKLLWAFDLEAIEGKRVKWEELRTFLFVEKRPIEVRLKLRTTGGNVCSKHG
ncbi:cytochrome P450 [Periconia macrospinosa]|uniref:Cytochrome P450 n=1 Tax=Periconia macrospinosa TaxID=97972 RepID=A0A2V1DHJ8_9PLEO|nr:cytochrome P450 [Periconia macrospinosa]